VEVHVSSTARRPWWDDARRYDLVDRLAGPHEAQWQLVAQAAIPPAGRVLEIGVGTGNVALRAARAVPGATVMGIDPDPVSLAAAAGKAARAGLPLHLDQGSAAHLPHPDASVDRVLSSLVFHHLDGADRLAALQEIRRVLVPGGSLHVLDLAGGRPLPAVRFLMSGLGHLTHPRPGRHPAPAPDAAGHGHGHGHGHGDGRGPTEVLALMAQAGLTDPVQVARGTSAMGELVFLRAQR
jgi:SAM-dependent methyltransferase